MSVESMLADVSRTVEGTQFSLTETELPLLYCGEILHAYTLLAILKIGLISITITITITMTVTITTRS